MKRLSIIFGLVLVPLLVASGCSSKSHVEAPETVTATATVIAPAPGSGGSVSGTSDYLDFVTSQSSGLDAIPDSVLLDVGQTLCDSWDRGTTLEETVMAAIASGVSSDDLAALVVGASLYLCPWQADSIQRQADSSNF